MTIIPFAAARCIRCKAPVAIVRRRIAYRCSSHGRVCSSPSLVMAVVDANGERHECAP